MQLPSNLFDSHAHINDKTFVGKLDEVVLLSKEAGIVEIWDQAVNLESAEKSMQISKLTKGYIKPSIGIHPELYTPGSELYIETADEAWLEEEQLLFEKMLDTDDWFAIGECGLDFYWLKKNNLTKKEYDKYVYLQTQLFIMQLDLAVRKNLPVFVHSRGAEEECIEITEKYADKLDIVMHSFTGSRKQMQRILEIGFFIGVNGIVTYKSASELREAVISLSDRSSIKSFYESGFLLETDSPYLVPSVLQKSQNNPASISAIWEFLDSF